MCDPTGIAIGAAIGAATSAATGGDPLQGAVLGGATGGFFPGSVGVENILGPTLPGAPALGSAISLSGVATAAGVGLGAGYVQNQLFAPPKPYQVPQHGVQQQQFNSQQIATTGSGGRQATASLAEAISRSKQRKLSQADVGDLSIDTSAFASTGLQLA